MSISKLAKIKVPADKSNYTPGRYVDYYSSAIPKNLSKISEITIHHMAGVNSAEGCGYGFQNPARNGSAHYGIGNDGQIANYVDEKDTAWANSNWEANCRAVTIETSNSKYGDAYGWPVSNAALSSLIKLVADIAIRNNLGKLVKGKNLTWHRLYAATQCIPIDSEVLTKTGWKLLSEIEEDEEIAIVNPDNFEIYFDKILGKVPEKTDTVYTNNGFTATGDHRMLTRGQGSKVWRFEQYIDVLKATSSRYIQMAGNFNGKGLDLTDDELRLLIAVQADGHYMNERHSNSGKAIYGLDFHLKKKEKL